jgi:hypothetical protein
LAHLQKRLRSTMPIAPGGARYQISGAADVSAKRRPPLGSEQPHVDEGEWPCWWEQAQGLNRPEGWPLSPDKTPT